ncbi:MAG: hypothetical protein AAF915_22100 [Cyanobacteria bacterium P01_D01_bin.50]
MCSRFVRRNFYLNQECRSRGTTSDRKQLSKATPNVIPPSAPAKTPEEVNKLVNTIEKNSQKIIKN